MNVDPRAIAHSPSLMQRALLHLVKMSWRCQRVLRFAVDKEHFRIPIDRGIGLQLLTEEADVAPLMRHFYQTGCRGTFVDIGANIGVVLLALLKIDRGINYVGFEPSLQAASYVQRLIVLNGLAATHDIYPVALGDVCGAATLQTSDPYDVSATIDSEMRPSSMYSSRTSVCVSQGDVLLHDVRSVDVIKIDVEGNERRVLVGLRDTIQRHRPALIMEIMPYRALADGSYPRSYFGELTEAIRAQLVQSRQRNMEDLASLMAQIGYKWYQMRAGSLCAAKPSESTPSNQDFVAIPAEQLSRFGAPGERETVVSSRS